MDYKKLSRIIDFTNRTNKAQDSSKEFGPGHKDWKWDNVGLAKVVSFLEKERIPYEAIDTSSINVTTPQGIVVIESRLNGKGVDFADENLNIISRAEAMKRIKAVKVKDSDNTFISEMKTLTSQLWKTGKVKYPEHWTEDQKNTFDFSFEEFQLDDSPENVKLHSDGEYVWLE